MAGAAVGGALLGLAFEETFKVSKKALMISIFCNSSCKKLKATLIRLKPTIDEISVVGSESSQHWQRQVQEFQDKIGGALDLIEKCQNTSRFHLYRKFRYAKRILNFEKDIHNFMLTHIVPNIMLDLKKLGLSVPDFSQRLRRLGELACELNNVLYKMANDVNANNVIYQQIPGNTFSQETDDDGMSAEAENSSYYVPDMPNFVVGFDNFITDLKKLLFQSDVNAIGLTGMSGRGKSTLTQAFCNDHQVKDSGTSNVLKLRIYEKVWQRSKVLQNDPVLFVRLSSILSKNHLQGKVYAARRMTYSRSETYVFLEPGKDEQFVTLEELRKRVRGWLERWPEKSLPKDLTKFNSLEDAAAHLVQSACELEIGRGIGSIQWYEVNLE